MKRGQLVVACIAFVSACDGDATSTDAAPPAPPATIAPARQATCRAVLESTTGQPPMGDLLGVTGGPAGVSVTTTRGLWQPGRWDTRTAPTEPWTWSHDAYLFHDGAAIVAMDSETAHRHTVVPLLPHAAHVALARIPDAAVVLYTHPARHTVSFVRWDDGAPAPTPPVEVLHDDPVLGLHARWDAARLVVAVDRATGGDTLVLDRQGHLLASALGHTIACPVAGCVSLLSAQAAGVDDRDPRDTALYARPLARPEAFAIPLGATDVRAVAVSGDRIAIAVRRPEREADGTDPWFAGVYDVPRRSLLAIAAQGAPSALTWTPGEPHEGVGVVASEGRFWWTVGAAPGPFRVYSMVCDP